MKSKVAPSRKKVSYIARVAIFLAILTLSVKTALACGMCAFAAFDSFMPPIFYWCAVAVLWYLTLLFIGTILKLRIPFLMPGKAGYIIVVICSLAALTTTGALTTLPFTLPALIVSIMAWSNIGSFKQNSTARIVVMCISIVILLSIGFGVLWRKNILATRTDAQMYLRWSGTMTGRALEAQFKREEPVSINEYRYIIDHGNGYTISFPAKRLGFIGDPSIDLPRLGNAMKRVDEFDKKTVQDAIDSLTNRQDVKMNSNQHK
jgi:hypothetical protein